MTTRRIVIAIVALGLLSVAVVVGIGWSWAAPWVAWPDLQGDALDRQWAALEARVATDPICHADASSLDAVLSAHEGAEDAVSDLLSDSENPVPVEQMPVAAQRSGELLVAWADAEGGVGSVSSPDDGTRILGLFQAAKAAGASDDPARVEAALRLGWGLRRCGPLLSGAVGMAIAEDVWSRQPEAFEPHLDWIPSADDVLLILHAEAVAGDAMLDLVDVDGPGMGWQRWLFDADRERAMLRAEWVTRLAGLPPDLEAIQTAFPDQTADEQPHSLVLRLLLTSVSYMVRDLSESVRGFD